MRRPYFAATKRRSGSTARGEERLLDLVHGTVDLLSTQDARRGAFTRVVPSQEGSAYVFTLHFEDDTPETAVARQMATVEEELRAVRAAVG